MSELQAALLAIGAGGIAAVYAFGWWQQRQYRQRFAAAFKTSHADALYREPGAAQIQESALADVTLGERLGSDSAPNLFDGICTLLDARSDFIIELQLNEAGPAAILQGLWQRKFDFGKPVHVCGMPLNSSQWERAVAESQTLYTRIRIALQLVNRDGAISKAKLADFQDLVLGVADRIKAEVTVSDINDAHHAAVELDAFCADVDQMAGVNLVPPGAQLVHGEQIAQLAGRFGMTLESDGAFHMLDPQRYSVFSLVSLDSEPFRRHELKTSFTAGITFLLDVPRVEDPVRQFGRMMEVARDFAKELQVDLVDDHRVPLSESGLDRIRARIVEVEAKMRDNGIAPGGAQARRLFS